MAKIDLSLCNGLLWIPTVDSSTIPNIVCVILKIRDADQHMMFLVHNGSENAISIPGGYVNEHENHIECGLRVVNSLLGIRVEGTRVRQVW